MDTDYKHVGLVGFMKHNGGIEILKISESEYQFRVTVQDYHLNPGGTTHGGFVMTVLDSGMGNAAHHCLGPNARAATISLDVKFISASTTGNTLTGTATILQKTRTLVFVRGDLHCEGKIVATAEGIWKTL